MAISEMESMIGRIRHSAKSKQRSSLTLKERIENRLEAIKDRSLRDSVVLDDWQIRQAYHVGIGDNNRL